MTSIAPFYEDDAEFWGELKYKGWVESKNSSWKNSCWVKSNWRIQFDNSTWIEIYVNDDRKNN